MTIRLLVSTIFLLASQCIFAASSCDIKAIIKQVWPDAQPTEQGVITPAEQFIKTQNGSPFSAICRIWPAHPELTLAAVPLMEPEQRDHNHNADLELLVLDTATLEVKQRLHLPERMNDDAIYISDLAIDTAHWKIAPEQTAFGLRIQKTGSSRVNPISEEALWLYTLDRGQLRVVLDGIVLKYSVGELDGNCAEEFTNIIRTLAMGATKHHGFSDIKVSEKNVASTAWLDENNECRSKDIPTQKTWTLQYDGKQYRVPAKLHPIQ
ncbi:TPA: hypothetical protein ACW7QF_000206 [Klebsiella aerogenes]|uniref:hypothetical protein n=1 Tax=Klebsiella TaxID=570 RepID=UPI002928EEAB|nr:hypothetical protein [Klebsiella sp. 141203]MDU9364777.1 hypothetical protein [Klebsiella sp. 141203]